MNREDNSDSLFPVQRMQFGLLQYAVGFSMPKPSIRYNSKKIIVATCVAFLVIYVGIHMQADATSLFSSLF